MNGYTVRSVVFLGHFINEIMEYVYLTIIHAYVVSIQYVLRPIKTGHVT
jgi:hypothetical protein